MNFDIWKRQGPLDLFTSMSTHFRCPIGIGSQPLVDDGFNIGLDFAAGFPEALSSSWIGIASLAYFSTPFTILIQDVA